MHCKLKWTYTYRPACILMYVLPGSCRKLIVALFFMSTWDCLVYMIVTTFLSPGPGGATSTRSSSLCKQLVQHCYLWSSERQPIIDLIAWLKTNLMNFDGREKVETLGRMWHRYGGETTKMSSTAICKWGQVFTLVTLYHKGWRWYKLYSSWSPKGVFFPA